MSKVYSIYDAKAQAFLQPFFLPNNEIAIRAFRDCVGKDGHNFNLHPEDYVLYQIGEWDEDKGEIIKLDVNLSLANGLHLYHECIRVQQKKEEMKLKLLQEKDLSTEDEKHQPVN